MKQRIIAITGGIGAGKSVVSHILRILGYPVYDSDSNAKALMDEDESIKERLRQEIDSLAVVDGKINRPRIAKLVFSDAEKLALLNAIVHGAVKSHFSEWCRSCDCKTVFIETAILFESGLNRIVDEEWRVVAPEEIRIARVMKRNGLSCEAVKARIESQKTHETEPRPAKSEILNDGRAAVLPQIDILLGRY